METVCHKQLSFESLDGKKFVADFQGGRITSDGGGLILREIDLRYEFTEGIACSLRDSRDPSRVIDDLSTLLRQRIFSIALGYEDNNDATTLRSDPALKAMAGRLPESADDLASQPTLSRFENAVRARDLRKFSDWLLRLYLKTHPGPREVIVLDMDSTDDPTHGHQQLSFFHGYFERHIYHPLLVFDGITGFPMAAVLRAGNTHASHRAVSVLKRIIKKLKKAYPAADIVLRADAGFAVPSVYRFCERHGIYYAIGLITNDRLRAKVQRLAAKARAQFFNTKLKQRFFTDFGYRANSWRRPRRVIAKVEHLDKGANQRFVLTNLKGLKPAFIYDEIYVLRGDVENRIKELKLELAADRLSCHRFVANYFRLLLHTAAYGLFWLLRRALANTELANAQVGTLRLKLLKVGARMRETTRRIWIHFASAYPYQQLFMELVQRLRTAPT
jgi:hypothetical protein